MGILNVTPDSFSDGGENFDIDKAVARGLEMVDEGADIIDVGGESTRPDAEPVDEVEELRRVVPVIEALAAQVNVPISVDTMKASVAETCLGAGATIVNDVSAARHDPKMLQVVAGSDAGLVLMHMLGDPRTMQKSPRYEDVVREVGESLFEWTDAAVSAGVAPERIAWDPGFGFGKTREHNLELLKKLDRFVDPVHTLLVGTSRKTFIGNTLDLPVEDRLEGTAATVAWAVAHGAEVVRVHDALSMTRVVRMIEAIASV